MCIAEKYSKQHSGTKAVFPDSFTGLKFANIIVKNSIQDFVKDEINCISIDTAKLLMNSKYGAISINEPLTKEKFEELYNQRVKEKEDTMINKTRDDLTVLVKKYYGEQMTNLNNTKAIALKLAKDKTRLGRVIADFRAALHGLNKNEEVLPPAEIFDTLFQHYVSPTEDKAIKQVDKDYDEACIDLRSKCQECETLLILADTFKEREAILKRYGIIKGGK